MRGAVFHRLAPIILCLCLLAVATPALAHRVLVFAFAEGETIHTESKFVGSGAVQKGKVLIQDKNTGRTLLTATTDDRGKFSFKIPPEAAAQRLDLLIVVEAGMGHQGEWLLKADKYLAGATPGSSTSAAPVSPAGQIAPAGRAATIDQPALEAALDKSLERHLAPLKEMLTDLTIHRTSLTDIIGGLGYILGIFGIVAYFMSKKQPKP